MCLSFGSVTNAKTSKKVVTVGNEKINIELVCDNSRMTIVKTEDSLAKYITKVDKKTNEISIETIDKKTAEKNITTKSLIEVNKVIEKAQKSSTMQYTFSKSKIYSEYSMFFDNSYYNNSDSEYWIIKNSEEDRKNGYESHFDSDELLNHKSAVDSLVNAEAAAIATGSVSAVSAVVAVITAPTGVGPIVGVLLALGFGIGCAYSIWNMYQQRDISDFHFGRA